MVVSVSVFILPVALSGAGVALPDIASDLHPSSQALQWVISGYNLTFASLMLTLGTLADRVGRRRIFAIGVTLFGASALVCTLANSIVLLDIARAVGGIGAGATLTAGSTVIAARFDGPARVRAFGLFGTAIGAGLAFGPLISGVMLSAMGWRGVFALPAVIGLIAAAFIPMLNESRNPDARPLDKLGTVTFTMSLFLLIFALVEAPAFGLFSGLVLGSLAASVLLFVAFYFAEKHQKAPMFDLALLRYPRFMAINMTASMLPFTLLPLLILLPTYFSAVDGYSALHIGLILILFTAPTLVVPLLAGPLARVLSLRAQLSLSMLLVGVGMAWLTVLGPGVSIAVLAGPFLVSGVGYGMTLAVIDGAAVSSVELGRAGMASGMFNSLRLSADTAAAAIGGSLLVSVTSASLNGKVADPEAVTEDLNAGVHTSSLAAANSFTSAMHVVIWIGAATALITVPVLLRALPHKDTEVPTETEAEEALAEVA
ncbi:MFS transporter [Streptomyces sp. NPDC058683]|uniref:MFS transporter n=1 Tax=Streptomyces sp. NPDC058683 TaxID=3346597 RepID=UPI003665F979